MQTNPTLELIRLPFSSSIKLSHILTQSITGIHFSSFLPLFPFPSHIIPNPYNVTKMSKNLTHNKKFQSRESIVRVIHIHNYCFIKFPLTSSSFPFPTFVLPNLISKLVFVFISENLPVIFNILFYVFTYISFQRERKKPQFPN